MSFQDLREMTGILFGLIGAGGFGREVIPFVKKSVARTLGISDSDVQLYFVETWEPKSSNVNGYPVISLDRFLALSGRKYFNVAIGNGKQRQEMAVLAERGAEPLSLWHDSSYQVGRNQIAEGAVFCGNTMVTSDAVIGRYFQCNIYSYVAHDCRIGDFVTFAPGVSCNGRVEIDDYAYIGTNAVLRQGTPDKPLRIGRGAVVGMGAVVTKDVPDGVTVVGNPARILHK